MANSLQVLTAVPETWSVNLLSGFLESSFRQSVTERNESLIMRALTNNENLTTCVRLVEKINDMGPRVEEVC